MNWIKIVCNILDHRKIKMIRKGPEGNTLVLLWLLILTEAGKCGRGGYLMISDSLPYSVETLSMVTDIPLMTVRLGLKIFFDLEMIDRRDDAIFVKNWRKYQSEDRLEARREKDRLRQQRHREIERSKLQSLPCPAESLSRDVTHENRTEKNRREKTTTELVRLLLSETCFEKVSLLELQGLSKRHGPEQLLLAADIAAQTWRRTHENKHNPGGYLQSLCVSLVVPDWYIPYSKRMEFDAEARHRKKQKEVEQAVSEAKEEAEGVARNALWDSLPEQKQEEYLAIVIANLPGSVKPAKTILTIMAKSLAWTEHSANGATDHYPGHAESRQVLD